jgi:two-component system, NarL family, invasion response regulator UvrY
MCRKGSVNAVHRSSLITYNLARWISQVYICMKDMAATVHILMADDHVIVRRGVQYLIDAHVPNVRFQEVAGCAALFQKLASQQFDLLLLDVMLPDGNTFDILPDLVERYPDMPILMYSMNPEEVYADRALQLGAKGFVSKVEEEAELMRAVHAVLRGRQYSSPVQELRSHEKMAAKAMANPFAVLSIRELSVMDQLLRGGSVGEIARDMGVTSSTIATYKARLFNKLGVGNMLHLQRKADLHGYKADPSRPLS